MSMPCHPIQPKIAKLKMSKGQRMTQQLPKFHFHNNDIEKRINSLISLINLISMNYATVRINYDLIS